MDSAKSYYDSERFQALKNAITNNSNFNIVDITEGKLIAKVQERVPNFDNGVLSGGFVAWLLGKTTKYSDIDIYYPRAYHTSEFVKELSAMSVNTTQEDKSLRAAAQFEEYEKTMPIFEISETHKEGQMIQNIYIHEKELEKMGIEWSLANFTKWIICSFDLDICRAAIFKHNEKYYFIECIGDVTFKKSNYIRRLKKENPGVFRMMTYLTRIPYCTIKNEQLSVIPFELANGMPMQLRNDYF